MSVAAIRRDLALHRAAVLEENGRRFKRLIWAFRFAGIVLIAEIIAWIIDLTTRVD